MILLARLVFLGSVSFISAAIDGCQLGPYALTPYHVNAGLARFPRPVRRRVTLGHQASTSQQHQLDAHHVLTVR